jgi:transcriptional regulator with XRE-family HTH domain
MALGKEIKRLREDVPISAQKLADRIGIDADRLRKWEQKDLDPRHDDVMLIEDFFGMDIKRVMSLSSIKKFLGTNENNRQPKDKVKFKTDDKTLLMELIRESRRTKATVNVLRIAVARLIATSEEIVTPNPEKEKVDIALGRLDRSINDELDKLYEIDKKKYD